MPYEFITTLLDFKGFQVSDIRTEDRSAFRRVFVTIESLEETHRCGECGKTGLPGYDSHLQEVRHLMWWQSFTVVRFRRYRVSCPDCGIRTEALDFVDLRGPRVTKPLLGLVYELCKVMTHKAVGILQGLHRGTVREIDKAMMEKVQSKRSLEGITVLGFDEIAVGKGQTYWTMISALEGPRGPELLNIVEGRKEKSLRTHCPTAQVIFDKFHVIRHLLEAVNEVRKQEFKRLGDRMNGLLAGKKFVLLSRRSNLKREGRKALKALEELLLVSPRLLKAHFLKETFGHLWEYKSRTWARKFFRKWVASLKWSRMKPLKAFAAMVEEHLDGILSYCEKKVPLGYVESTNQKAKNVIRRAYGYRDEKFKKLKIIQACTPWMNNFQPWSHDP